MATAIDRLRAKLGSGRLLFWAVMPILAVGLASHVLFSLQPFFMDELPVLRNQLRFIHQLTLVPDHAKYPTFFYYLSLPATAGSIFFEFFLDGRNTIAQVAARMLMFEQRELAMGSRLFNIFLFYLASAMISRIIWRHVSPTSAVLTFLLLTSAPGMLQYSAYALPEVTLILLSAAALALLYEVKGLGESRRFFFAIALIGLAISTKYNGASLLLPAAVWGVALFLRSGTVFSQHFLSFIGISLAILFGSFLLGSPGWIIATDFFLAELMFEIDHARAGHFGSTGIPILGQFELLVRQLPVLFLLALPGIVLSCRNGPRTCVLPISLIIGTLVLAAGSAKQSFHYLFPAIPGFAILASYTIASLVSRFRQTGTAAVVIVALAAALTAFYSAAQFLRPNTTELAKAWIVENVPQSAPIVTAWAYVPRLHTEESLEILRQRDAYKALGSDPLALEPSFRVSSYSDDFGQLEASDAQYLVTSSQVFDRFFKFGTFTGIKPKQGDPMQEEFANRREFYQKLFASSSWKIVFEAETGNGPRTLVFQRARE